MYSSGSGSGRAPNRYKPYDRNNGKMGRVMNLDRNCIECGLIIKGQALEKPMVCPRSTCRHPLPNRNGADENGWGRCSSCDGFMHVNHSYCQCGWPNVETIERKKRQKIAAAKAEEFKRNQYIKDLENQVRLQQKEIKEKKKELEEMHFDTVVVAEVNRLRLGEDENMNEQEDEGTEPTVEAHQAGSSGSI